MLSGVAFVEMFTNFHLPTCWLYSDDPYVVVQLQEVERSYENWRWVTATGIFFNPNNFCLLLAALAVFSLPARYESPAMRRFSSSLVCIALWCAPCWGPPSFPLRFWRGWCCGWCFLRGDGEGVCWWGSAAVLCYLLLPDLCMRAIMPSWAATRGRSRRWRTTSPCRPKASNRKAGPCSPA